ncbi:MAG: transcriptional repressor [Elusimicrobia bacterium]|nr:transcriptional repressor [Elusimicrobiota bacterium]
MKTAKKDLPAGYRMTPQRAEILRILDGNTSHPTAEDIYSRLLRRLPGVSFATVYNTLQSLISMGELAEVRIERGRSRFDPGKTPHAHLMCVRCGRIADVRAPARTPSPAGRPRGFKVLSCTVEFFGICPACGKKAAAKETKKCLKKRTKR